MWKFRNLLSFLWSQQKKMNEIKFVKSTHLVLATTISMLFSRNILVFPLWKKHGNLLSRIFGKNFVKVTVLLKKLLRVDLTKYFLVRVKFTFLHSVWKLRKFTLILFYENFVKATLILIKSKELISRKKFWLRENFSFFSHCETETSPHMKNISWI